MLERTKRVFHLSAAYPLSFQHKFPGKKNENTHFSSQGRRNGGERDIGKYEAFSGLGNLSRFCVWMRILGMFLL